jgi:enediyne biosynthesis protein E4
MRLHFGLGAATKIDKLEVKWPDGAPENVSVGGCDRLLTIVEGKGVVNNQKLR